MSFPNPSAAMKNSSIPMGKADTSVVIAKILSSANELLARNEQITTAMIAAPPETPVIMGVMCVMSRIGCLHIV